MSTRVRRLAFGVSGQALARIVTIANTLALVPILIQAWGLSGYGQWIGLTAFASYLSYSNFGLATTSAYEVVMAAGAGDTPRARRAYQMSANLVLYIILPLILALLILFSLLPVVRVLNLDAISEVQVKVILALIAAQIWTQTLRGTMAAALQAAGSYGLSYCIAAAAKFLELVAIIVAVRFFHGHQVSAAAIMTVCAVIDAFTVWLYVRHRAKWARMNPRIFDISWVRSQIKPTLGLLLSTFANQGILVQGPRILLSALLGPAAVALYSVYATAVRATDQLVLMFALPVGMEVASAAGGEDRKAAYRMIVASTKVSLFLFVATAGFLMLAGPIVFKIWTHGAIVFDRNLAVAYLIMSAFIQLGRVSWISLVSTNRLYGPSYLTVAVASAGICAGGVLSTHLGIIGMVGGLAAAELVNALIMTKLVSRWAGVSLAEFVADIFDVRTLVLDMRALWRRFVKRFARS